MHRIAPLWIVLAACGGSTQASETAKEANTTSHAEDHSVNTFENNPGASSDAKEVRTHSPLLLGHFSSPDGAVGFVLDRTGDQPLIRIDGSDEVIPLTTETVGAQGDQALVKPDGGHAGRIMQYGGIEFYQNNETYHMVRDADAAPLTPPDP